LLVAAAILVTSILFQIRYKKLHVEIDLCNSVVIRSPNAQQTIDYLILKCYYIHFHILHSSVAFRHTCAHLLKNTSYIDNTMNQWSWLHLRTFNHLSPRSNKVTSLPPYPKFQAQFYPCSSHTTSFAWYIMHWLARWLASGNGSESFISANTAALQWLRCWDNSSHFKPS
jgi:hypothetical protein